MRFTRHVTILLATTVLLSAGLASAAPPRRKAPAPAPHPLAPIAGQTELGLYGGLLLPAREHSFFGTQWRPLRPALGSLGVRIGYYPLRWGGVEAEAGGFPGFTKDGDYFNSFAVRGHAILQLPYRVAPFVLGGAGALMVRTPNAVLGTDTDPALHLGLGLKVGLLPWLRLRCEWRATLTNDRRGAPPGVAMHNELLLGVTFVFGPRAAKEPARPPPDADGDGVLDANDRCPRDRGSAPDGCPRADRDGDSVVDASDACPDEPGPAPDGCPPPAPVVADVAPGDHDGDGVLDPADTCPDRLETRNGFDDHDGCPDDLPPAIARYTGALKGIDFAADSADISARSHAVLDEVAQVLVQYPSLRLAIVGHTDDRGTEAYNVDLSRRRAEAVRRYLLGRAVAPERLTASGVGGARPIASNLDAAGRAENRRIEFELLTE